MLDRVPLIDNYSPDGEKLVSSQKHGGIQTLNICTKETYIYPILILPRQGLDLYKEELFGPKVLPSGSSVLRAFLCVEICVTHHTGESRW